MLKRYAVKIDLPPEVESVMNTLLKNGFEAYIAGGAVRDFLMKRKISDYDITTNALPCDMHKIFKKCFDTGLKHGTVTAVENGMRIEITTYRIDGEYQNHRSPESVKFSQNLSDDLKRRDFTVNALVYNPNEGILDFFSGADDIKTRIIRAVGDADRRFFEDALRIIRAVRFACVLGFDIEKSTFEAMRKNRKYLNLISCERIRDEFSKILCAKKLDALEMSAKKGIFDEIFPDISKIYDFGKISDCKGSLCVKWALFIYYMNKKSADEILRRLKFSNAEKSRIKFLLAASEFEFNTSRAGLKRILQKCDAFLCDIADFTKAIGKFYPEDEISGILKSGEPYKISMLSVSGNDVKMYAKKDEDMGRILNYLLEAVIENPSENSKTALTERIKNFYDS